MGNDRHDKAVEQLCEVLGLSEEALDVAEGWSILPVSIQRHFKLLIDDYISNLSPALTDLYANVHENDQLRFNRVIERIQNKKRNDSAGGD